MKAVTDILSQCISDFEIRIKNESGDSMKLHEKLLKNLEKKMKELEAKELAQWEAQANPDPSQRMPPEIFKKLNEKLLQEKAEVMEAMCNARKSMPEPVDYEEKLHRFKDALDALQNPDMNAQQKNRLLKDCIEKITYKREKPVRLSGKGAKFGGAWTNPPFEIDVKLRV